MKLFYCKSCSIQFFIAYLFILLFNSLVNPEFRLFHQEAEIVQVIFDLFVALDVAVGHQELDLAEGSEDLLPLREVTEQQPAARESVWHHQDWGRVMGGELIIRQITAERNHNLSANLIKNHFIMAR